MNWKSVNSDPNDLSVQQERLVALRAAQADKLIDNREDYLVSQVSGQRVLDVGVVAHTIEAQAHQGWLHRRIRDSASYAVGCDILKRASRVASAIGIQCGVP